MSSMPLILTIRLVECRALIEVSLSTAWLRWLLRRFRPFDLSLQLIGNPTLVHEL